MTTPSTIAATPVAGAGRHREVLEALSGLLLGLFVTILSSTVVSSSLPVIVSDIGGGQSAYTWVVTATLLATTVSTPIWGKLADLFSRKLLVQIALVIFVLGSALAGLSTGPGMLISFRVLQGLGAGGMTALATIVMADLISPRERGKYMGMLGGVMGVAMVAGPLIGGVITDSFGWRWNFFIGVPIAAIAITVLQKTLHLPRIRRTVRIDYLGAGLIAGGVSLLLVWVSLAGEHFDWVSVPSALMVVGSLALLGLAVWVEQRAAEPIIPMHLFKMRTVVLSVIASVVVGIAMFGASVFLGEYLQLSRGQTPTAAGLLTIPMILGMFIASTVIGQVISRTGKYKLWMALGAVLMTIGFALMGTLDAHTSFAVMGCYLALVGIGTGMLMQNLVLIVQNEVSATEMGSASATVAFFRSMGGAIGVSVLGAILGTKVNTLISTGIVSAQVPPAQLTALSAGLPEPAAVKTLPEPLHGVIADAFAGGVSTLFTIAAVLSIVSIVAILLLKERPLGTSTAVELLAEAEDVAGLPADEPVDPSPAAPTAPAVPAGAAATGGRRSRRTTVMAGTD